jgi:hypothetical protein
MPPRRHESLTYIRRLHDEMLVGLFRAARKGNFLLVGRRGEGKTESLSRFSDLLIDSGAEFSLLPSGRRSERSFVSPFAKINLIDDVYLQLSDQLLKALNGTRLTALNVMTAEPAAVNELSNVIGLDGVIEIRTLALEQQSGLISEWQKANDIDKGLLKANELIKEYIQSRDQNPRELTFLLESLQRGSITSLKTIAPPGAIDLVKPRIITLNKQLADAIRKKPSRLDALSPGEFEEFVGELFEQQGYKVTLTRKSADGGIDVIAEKKDILDFLILAQCKKYAPHRPIGAQIIREMTGVLDINKATAGAIFTTSRFTGTAVKEAKTIRHKLSLFDYFDILMCLNSSGQFKQ